MKKLLLAAILALLVPSSVLADSFQKGQVSPTTSTGTSTQLVNGVAGDCLSIKPAGASAPILNVSCTGNMGIAGTYSPAATGSSYAPIYIAGTFPGIGQAPLANHAYTYGQSYIYPGFVIGHIAVSCANYTLTDATANNSTYATLGAGGLGGSTVTFAVVDNSNFFASPLVLGTVVIPSSPQAGPWVTSGVSTVATPYTVTTNTSILTQITATNTGAGTVVKSCVPTVGS